MTKWIKWNTNFEIFEIFTSGAMHSSLPLGKESRPVQACTSSSTRTQKGAKMEMQRTPWVLKVSKSWLGCVSLSASLSRSLDAAMEKYPVPAWRTRWKLWVGHSVGNLCRNLFKFMNYAKLQETIRKKYTKTIEYTFQCFDNKKKHFSMYKKTIRKWRCKGQEMEKVIGFSKKGWKRNYVWEDLKATTLEAAFATSWKSFLEALRPSRCSISIKKIYKSTWSLFSFFILFIDH